jgi:hypothetical protein
MDISTLSTPTQMILAWVMSGILFAWFIIFVALAFRRDPDPERQEQREEQPTPAGSFPAVTVQVGQTNSAN